MFSSLIYLTASYQLQLSVAGDEFDIAINWKKTAEARFKLQVRILCRMLQQDIFNGRKCGGQPENLLTNLRLSPLILFLLITLEYSV
jgi:hypothetical protein